MDGVLVDVGDSYRETIVQTVRHFTGKTISRELVQDYKNQGGWNNDWALSRKIAEDLGAPVPYDVVVEQFIRLWKGHGDVEGLVARERWIPQTGLLEDLATRFRLAIFTGRMRWEADITLNRFAAAIPFDPMICAEDVEMPKPAPDGLLRIAKTNPGLPMFYFGDVIDDARASRSASVPFVGVVAAHHARRDEVLAQFGEQGAVAVIENINQIGEVVG
jgi:HAD superfamily phosphatase